ncbi:MAG TPA: glycosyltransferase [Puia sp.]|nr:glycosyltransferase [Puia sp.]
MKKYYISSVKGNTAISRYSHDFYELVLRDKGYIFMDSSKSFTEILSAVASRDQVHIEIGSAQKKETELLFVMLKAKYKYVSVTLHDPPLIFPFFEFRNPILNQLSRLYKRYINHSGSVDKYIGRIKSIYVVSRKSIDLVKRKYQVENVFYLPYIINPHEIEKNAGINNNFICFNPNGSKKEIAYCLKLHRRLIAHDPDVNLYVTSISRAGDRTFFPPLDEKKENNIHYAESQDEDLFSEAGAKATFVFMPASQDADYRRLAGSNVLEGLKKGKIVFTNNRSVTPEYIQNGKNGFYLSGSLREDTETIRKILSDPSLLARIRKETYSYLIEHHSADEVSKQFKD